MESSEVGFEILASSLRAESGDLKTFVEVLATKLEGALPELTGVDRKGGGFFSKEKRVRRISVELGDSRYTLVVDGAQIEATFARTVRGIVLKTERLPLEEWIDALSQDLAMYARSSEQARTALERLLGG